MGGSLHGAHHEHGHPDGHLLPQRARRCGRRPNRIATQCFMPLSMPSILVLVLSIIIIIIVIMACTCCVCRENEFDLLIGWADCFRQVRIISQSSGAEEEETGYLLNESGVSAITVQVRNL